MGCPEPYPSQTQLEVLNVKVRFDIKGSNIVRKGSGADRNKPPKSRLVYPLQEGP